MESDGKKSEVTGRQAGSVSDCQFIPARRTEAKFSVANLGGASNGRENSDFSDSFFLLDLMESVDLPL